MQQKWSPKSSISVTKFHLIPSLPCHHTFPFPTNLNFNVANYTNPAQTATQNLTTPAQTNLIAPLQPTLGSTSVTDPWLGGTSGDLNWNGLYSYGYGGQYSGYNLGANWGGFWEKIRKKNFFEEKKNFF